MTAFQINDDEREALRGLPHLSRLVYVFGLRPFMDYSSGVVGGPKRGVSWKSIAEELYIEPHQGIKGGEPSEKELRRALAWLQKVGLVGPNQAERRLIFELPKASRDQSVRKKVGSKWADEAGREAVPRAPTVCGAFASEEDREVAGGDLPKVGTPPVSGLPTTSSSAHEQFEPGSRFPMYDDWNPSDRGWRATLFRNGLDPGVLTDERMREFRSYWINRPEKYQSQGQWEHELAQALLRAKRRDESRTNVDDQRNSEAQEGDRNVGSASARPHGRGGQSKRAASPVEKLIAQRQARALAETPGGRTLDQDGRTVRP
ncbi:DnaT-like ssDNA-binding domain-containing protein [Stutzerimonas stutzeri]